MAGKRGARDSNVFVGSGAPIARATIRPTLTSPTPSTAVPASFITRSTADAILSAMRASERVFVSLDWSDALPKQETVALEFWTNSNDQCGAMCDVQKDFIRSFVSLAEVRHKG